MAPSVLSPLPCQCLEPLGWERLQPDLSPTVRPFLPQFVIADVPSPKKAREVERCPRASLESLLPAWPGAPLLHAWKPRLSKEEAAAETRCSPREGGGNSCHPASWRIQAGPWGQKEKTDSPQNISLQGRLTWCWLKWIGITSEWGATPARGGEPMERHNRGCVPSLRSRAKSRSLSHPASVLRARSVPS